MSKDREYIFDEIPHSDIWYELDKKSAAKYLEEFHEDVTNFVNCFLIPEGGTLSSETIVQTLRHILPKGVDVSPFEIFPNLHGPGILRKESKFSINI